MAKNNNNHGGARPGAGRKKKTSEGSYEHVTFTAEQLKELIDCPHVAYVSSKTVSYTKAFKDMAWQRYCDGIDPMQIFSDAGLNVDTLERAVFLVFSNFYAKPKLKAFRLPKAMSLILLMSKRNFLFRHHQGEPTEADLLS